RWARPCGTSTTSTTAAPSATSWARAVSLPRPSSGSAATWSRPDGPLAGGGSLFVVPRGDDGGRRRAVVGPVGEEGGHVGRGHRLGEQRALAAVEGLAPEPAELLGQVDALGQRVEPERLAQPDEAVDQRIGLGRAIDGG